MVRAEVPAYDELQGRVADATSDLTVARILDLGSGTGETASRLLEYHPHAALVGVDASTEMLGLARVGVPGATFVEGRLDPLPDGPFDLVVSAFAVHHLAADAKADLFRRIAEVLSPTGRFVLCDVVHSDRSGLDTRAPRVRVDLPNWIEDQLRWLDAAGLDASVVLAEADLAILRADRR